MRIEQDQDTHRRLLRKSAFADARPADRAKTKKRANKPNGSRFVGPAQLDDDQRSRLIRALEREKIGDDIGRQIFIGAVEYQLSAFAHLMEHGGEPLQAVCARNQSREQTLREIAGKAHDLSRLLRALPADARAHLVETLATQDRLGRGYDERYLCELGCEIDRLESACAAADGDLQPPEPDPGSSREFVAKLAGIFHECFETDPTAAVDGPFRAALAAVGEVTGLAIGQEPAFLAQVLADQAAADQAAVGNGS